MVGWICSVDFQFWNAQLCWFEVVVDLLVMSWRLWCYHARAICQDQSMFCCWIQAYHRIISVWSVCWKSANVHACRDPRSGCCLKAACALHLFESPTSYGNDQSNLSWILSRIFSIATEVAYITERCVRLCGKGGPAVPSSLARKNTISKVWKNLLLPHNLCEGPHCFPFHNLCPLALYLASLVSTVVDVWHTGEALESMTYLPLFWCHARNRYSRCCALDHPWFWIQGCNTACDSGSYAWMLVRTWCIRKGTCVILHHKLYGPKVQVHAHVLHTVSHTVYAYCILLAIHPSSHCAGWVVVKNDDGKCLGSLPNKPIRLSALHVQDVM